MGLFGRLSKKDSEKTIRVNMDFFVDAAGWEKSRYYLDKHLDLVLKGVDEDYIDIPESDYIEAEAFIKEKKERNRQLNETARLNNLGTKCEKEGHIEEAISIYEECIGQKYPARHAFERLAILYHKKKDYRKEEDVLKTMLDVFKNDFWASNRLEKLTLKKN